MAVFTRVVVPTPTTEVPASLPTVPIPRGGLLLRSYIKGWPLTILCLSWNVIVSFTLSTPPDSVINLASNLILSFFLLILVLISPHHHYHLQLLLIILYEYQIFVDQLELWLHYQKLLVLLELLCFQYLDLIM